MKRTLSLQRETLTELTIAELLDVAGAAAPPTSPAGYCLNTQVVCYTEAAGNSRCLCPTEV